MDNVLYKEISNKDGEALPEDQLKLRKHIDNLLVERVINILTKYVMSEKVTHYKLFTNYGITYAA